MQYVQGQPVSLVASKSTPVMLATRFVLGQMGAGKVMCTLAQPLSAKAHAGLVYFA